MNFKRVYQRSVRVHVPFYLIFILSVLSGCGRQKDAIVARQWWELAQCSLREESHDRLREGIQHIDRAIALDHDASFYATKGTLLCKLQQYEQSRACFEQALSSCSADQIALRADIMNNYACVAAELGDSVKAKELWQALISGKSVYATSEVAWCNLARQYLSEGEEELALESLEQAIDCKPDYVDALYYLALLRASRKEYEEALSYVCRVCSLTSCHAGAFSLRDFLYARVKPKKPCVDF